MKQILLLYALALPAVSNAASLFDIVKKHSVVLCVAAANGSAYIAYQYHQKYNQIYENYDKASNSDKENKYPLKMHPLSKEEKKDSNSFFVKDDSKGYRYAPNSYRSQAQILNTRNQCIITSLGFVGLGIFEFLRNK